MLETRLRHAQADDERPARYALARSVLDWYRTGIAQPIPKATATSLVPGGLEPAEVDSALRWACESALGVGRTTRQSLLTETPGGDALTVHDYVLDADSRVSGRAVPDAVWTAAMDHASSDEARFAVGYAAATQGNAAMASRAWLPLAQAAEAGNADAIYNLGKPISDSEPDEARRWSIGRRMRARATAWSGWEPCWPTRIRARRGGCSSRRPRPATRQPMFNLGNLLADSDPQQAVRWMRRAASAGKVLAMYRLGSLIIDRDPTGARRWWQRAAELGDTDAMVGLGISLTGTNRAQARRWFQRAADAGSAVGMTGLGNPAVDHDPEQARYRWEQAAEAGNPLAIHNLAGPPGPDQPEARES